ncbi:MAG: hypothetical protein LUI14_10750 [Lachnospiraceae bacterium]|nr:hypothetical protein [Lachnospiraceae bacterium]
MHIFAQKKITIESGCLVGWNVTLMDRDGHNIYDLNGTHINPNNDVYIGSNVWLCSYCSILKGSKVGENSIVGYGAIVSNDFKEGNIIVAGIPAKCVRSKVNWTI